MTHLIRTAAVVMAALLLAGCATTTRQNTVENGRPARLQLLVELPPGMSIIEEHEVSDAFAHRVITSLHENGFRGRIRFVEPGFTPAPNIPVLVVNLYEWRVDRTGMVDCTFAANLRTPNGTRSLGLFHGTAFMTWSRRDWFARAQDFENAAANAVTTLASQLEETGLLEPIRTQ